jgi:hypothetical protein
MSKFLLETATIIERKTVDNFPETVGTKYEKLNISLDFVSYGDTTQFKALEILHEIRKALNEITKNK